MKMEKIYPNADLKLVNKVVVYASYNELDNYSGNGYLYRVDYFESEDDDRLNQETLMKLLTEGNLIITYDNGDDKVFLMPTGFKLTSSDGLVIWAKDEDDTNYDTYVFHPAEWEL